MANIDLLNIEPHQVSRDLRGYSVFLYGPPKCGKTTLSTRFPNHLLIATEKGFNAIPGAMAQPINSWGDFKKVLKQLKNEEVKKKFSSIIIDTVDILYDYCEAYICANVQRPDGGVGVDSIGEIPFGRGYTLLSKEFDECLRSIMQMDYGLVLISHAVDKTLTDSQGREYNQIMPTLSLRGRNIALRMCDLVGYACPIPDEDGKIHTKLFLRGTPRYIAGSRFKYTPDVIDFTYDALVKAIGDAIDKQMAEDGKEYFTDERNNLYNTVELNFDSLMNEFNSQIARIQGAVDDTVFHTTWMPKITEIIEKYLGKGQKVGNIDRSQTEALDLIVSDLKELKVS